MIMKMNGAPTGMDMVPVGEDTTDVERVLRNVPCWKDEEIVEVRS